MKRNAKPVPTAERGLMMTRNGLETREQAIRRLERWHRTWEINNRERLITPTFATHHEVTHDHDWYRTEELSPNGLLMDRCSDCGIYRAHVPGTESPIGKMYQALYDAKHA